MMNFLRMFNSMISAVVPPQYKLWLYLGLGLLLLYLIFSLTKGFVWFLIQTVIYLVLLLVLLVYLKKKGFFK